jgi:hypothetical protein
MNVSWTSPRQNSSSAGPMIVAVDRLGLRRVPSRPIATEVEDDRRQPRSQLQLEDPLCVVAAQRTVGADERVLGDLLGVARVAQHPERDRVEPILVSQDEPFERTVDVARESPRQVGGRDGRFGLHRSMKHQRAAFGCMRPPIRRGSLRSRQSAERGRSRHPS